MKIALITIWHENNYGAELQAYATIKAIQELGHKVELIDIRLSDIEHLSLKGNIAKTLEVFTPASAKFNRFWKKYIPLTRRYRSIEELKNCPPEADIYMVGSDQVWNPDITKELTEVFFLTFGKPLIRKVSYASSFGTDSWNYRYDSSQIYELLHKFNHITVREESGVNLLKETFKLDADCVVDPTLLFSNYPELTGELKESNTLVYYPLHNDPELEKCALDLSQLIGLKPINNRNQKFLYQNFIWDCNSIETWVKNIAQSKFVLTRSFHGLVFSVLYNRQFAILAGKNNRSTRIQNLITKLGLEDRYFSTVSEFESRKPWKDVINYAPVNNRLDILRKESWNILKDLINP